LEWKEREKAYDKSTPTSRTNGETTILPCFLFPFRAKKNKKKLALSGEEE
jgi:hypothetical protein